MKSFTIGPSSDSLFLSLCFSLLWSRDKTILRCTKLRFCKNTNNCEENLFSYRLSFTMWNLTYARLYVDGLLKNRLKSLLFWRYHLDRFPNQISPSSPTKNSIKNRSLELFRSSSTSQYLHHKFLMKRQRIHVQQKTDERETHKICRTNHFNLKNMSQIDFLCFSLW